ncbi:MAG: hypothetical protein RML99_13205, partial [Anaerolineae bacterium]|nr:hypothetical protein [Anaerolineae bacterium]
SAGNVNPRSALYKFARGDSFIYRIEARAKPSLSDAHRAAVAADIQTLGIVAPVTLEVADPDLIGERLDERDVARIAEQLLCDPVAQTYIAGASPQPADARWISVAGAWASAPEIALFSDSNDRIAVEIMPEHAIAFEAMLHGLS